MRFLHFLSMKTILGKSSKFPIPSSSSSNITNFSEGLSSFPMITWFSLKVKLERKHFQSGFIALYVWKIGDRTNLIFFKDCHYSGFYIIISLSFWKIETKSWNSDPLILIFLVLETSSQAAYLLFKY